jgi:hypothetical protein
MILIGDNWYPIEDANDIVSLLRELGGPCDVIADALRNSLRGMNNKIELMSQDIYELNETLSRKTEENKVLKDNNIYFKELLSEAGIPYVETRYEDD